MHLLATLLLISATLLAQNPGPEEAVLPVQPQAPAQPPAPGLGSARNSLGETILSPRIRNITRLHNSMPHQLIGIGLVTGLATTGSSDRGSRQAMLNIVRQMGLNLTIADVVGGTSTLVTLTCTLPPFAKEGQQLDVKCEVMTDARSLRGGELLRAELRGVDGQVYVVAQGPVTVNGIVAKGEKIDYAKNPAATGWVLNNGLVVREQECSFYSESGALELQLLNPSPYNSASVAAGIATALDGMNARVCPVDTSLVRIELPEEERTNQTAIRILNLVGNTRVAVENPAKIMIDQASGTVLAGEGVLISPCVVGLSEYTIAIVNEEDVVQPNPFGQGTTERVARGSIEVKQDNTELQQVGGSGATVSDLLANLKTLGLTPEKLVAVFQALDQGGFLHAQLEVR
jgi:flagellar P-ring protein FlgI